MSKAVILVLLLRNLKFREVTYLSKFTLLDTESKSQVQHSLYYIILFLPSTLISSTHNTNDYLYRVLVPLNTRLPPNPIPLDTIIFLTEI